MQRDAMLALRVPVKNAEAAKKLMKDSGLIEVGYTPFSREGFFYIPLCARPSVEKEVEFKGTVLEAQFKKKKPRNLAEALRERSWTEGEVALAPRAFDLVGDIAVLEVNERLAGREKEIAEALMESNPHVKVVVNKIGPVHGELRLRKLEVLAGEDRTATVHKEAGCLFKLDVAEAWFSPRFAFERQRIASLVKPEEKVLTLFAGVGPYPIAIARKQPSAEIVAVELNHRACEFMRENLRLNRVANVKVVEGDARVIVPRDYVKWADRIVMPLPLGGKNFLDVALAAAGKKCSIHFYATGRIEDPFEEALRAVDAACRKAGREHEVLGKRIVLPYSPGIARVVVDFQVIAWE